MEKVKAYAALGKLRLASLVVFSAATGYGLGAESFNWLAFLWLSIGGFLTTASANTFNQIWERNVDAKMSRTQNRPIPTGMLSVSEAFIFGLITGVVGILLIWFLLNPLAGALSALALFLYVFAYTPLKGVTSWAVFVGAIPGSIPPMLGFVAATGEFGFVPGLLFFVQFMWQFPHFWAIAWRTHEDYLKAGYFLLPLASGKSKASAFQILLYTTFLIPVGLLPFAFGISGIWAAILATASAFYMLYFALRLYNNLDDKDALKLMFASFVYLPIVQVAIWADKLI